MSPTTTTNEDEHLQRQTATATEIAERFQITTQEIADQAARHLDGVLALRRAAEDHHRPTIQLAHAAWKSALAMLNKIDAPLERAEKLLRGKLGGWVQEQQRKREEEQRRLEAEQRRIQKEEAERAAAEAEAQGASEEEVEAVMDQVMLAPPPVVPQAPRAPVVSGFTPRETWAAGLGLSATGHPLSEDQAKKLLCAAIASGAITSNLVDINWTVANQLARAQKNTMNIPGLRAVRNATIAQGRK